MQEGAREEKGIGGKKSWRRRWKVTANGKRLSGGERGRAKKMMAKCRESEMMVNGVKTRKRGATRKAMAGDG